MADNRTGPAVQHAPSVPELSMEQAVDVVTATYQRQVQEGAKKILEGLAIWADVEEHTTRWLDELPGLIKSHRGQIALSVSTVTKGSVDAAKRMKGGEPLPPVQVIHPINRAVGQ